MTHLLWYIYIIFIYSFCSFSLSIPFLCPFPFFLHQFPVPPLNLSILCSISLSISPFPRLLHYPFILFFSTFLLQCFFINSSLTFCKEKCYLNLPEKSPIRYEKIFQVSKKVIFLINFSPVDILWKKRH